MKRLEDTKRQREEFEILENLRKEEEKKKMEIKRENEQNNIENSNKFITKKGKKSKNKKK
jgi:hypothetical protein